MELGPDSLRMLVRRATAEDRVLVSLMARLRCESPAERWLIPGQSAATGDGWVVELPGLAIRMAAGTPDVFRRGQPSKLAAQVQLMCGCPITAGGMWDAAHYEVTAELRQRGAATERLSFGFVEAPGRFTADWTPTAGGRAELLIIARNRITGNTGVLTRRVTIR
jgi:hypothetical protein